MLGIATVLIFLFAHWDLLNDSLVASFAINGALHAIALILTLRSPQSTSRKIAFVTLAAAFSVFTLYIGIAGLGDVRGPPGNRAALRGTQPVLGVRSHHLWLAHSIVLAGKILVPAHLGYGIFMPAWRLPGVLHSQLR